MSFEYVIDTYAWIEYFKGSKQGKIALQYIERGNSITSAVTIAELAYKYQREKKSFNEDYHFILSISKIQDVTNEIARMAGELNAENKEKIHNWGMADSIILATAKRFNVKVVTGDSHFRSLNSIMIA